VSLEAIAEFFKQWSKKLTLKSYGESDKQRIKLLRRSQLRPR
jgi:hypothetical protein